MSKELIKVRLSVSASGVQIVEMTRAQFDELTARLDDELILGADEARADMDSLVDDLEFEVDEAEELAPRKTTQP